MINYKKYLEQFNINKELYEKSISSEIKSNIKRFNEVGDFKSLLNDLYKIIDNIKKLSLNIDYVDIKYKKENDELEIHYTTELNSLLSNFDVLLFDLYDNDVIMNKIFQDGYKDMFLEIKLSGIFNQLDILNGLPNFMKKLGLGQKIYKKLIKDFDYISSFYGIKPSIDSDMVWDKIADDKEIFTFLNDNNIICFWSDYKYENIIKILKEFYKHKGVIILDDDFCKKYNINTKNFLKNI